MEFKNTIFAILAIFCLVLSACAVSAADNTSQVVIDDMFDGTERDFNMTEMSDSDDMLQDNATDDLDGEDIHDSMILPPDYAHNEAAMMNATNATGHAAGENATNTTASANTMPATGNPILALLAVGAVLGGACVLRKK